MYVKQRRGNNAARWIEAGSGGMVKGRGFGRASFQSDHKCLEAKGQKNVADKAKHKLPQQPASEKQEELRPTSVKNSQKTGKPLETTTSQYQGKRSDKKSLQTSIWFCAHGFIAIQIAVAIAINAINFSS